MPNTYIPPLPKKKRKAVTRDTQKEKESEMDEGNNYAGESDSLERQSVFFFLD